MLKVKLILDFISQNFRNLPDTLWWALAKHPKDSWTNPSVSLENIHLARSSFIKYRGDE